MIEIYFDDSGTHASSDVVGYAALIGVRNQWSEFSETWTKKLAAPLPNMPPLQRFHMAECEAGTGEFSHYSRAMRDRVIYDFRQIIVGSGVFGATATVPVAIWDELITGELRAKYGNAETECFHAALGISLSFVSHYLSVNDVSLIFDHSPGREAFQKAATSEYEKFYAGGRPPVSPLKIATPRFVSSYDCPPLQAADIVAWEANNYARERVRDSKAMPRPHFAEFVNSDRFRGGLMSRADVMSYVTRTK